MSQADGVLIGVPPSAAGTQPVVAPPVAAPPAIPAVTVVEPVVEVDSVQKITEKARLEERSKLRDQIDRAEKDAAKAREELAAFRAQNANPAVTVPLAIPASAPSGADLRSLVSAAVSDAVAPLKAGLDAAQKDALEARAEARKTALASYRAGKISSARGQVIAEMVRGDSEAEIDATFSDAVAAFKRYAPQGAQTINAPGTVGAPVVPPSGSDAVRAPTPVGNGLPPVTSNGLPSADPEESLRQEMAALTPEDRVKRRAEFRKRAAQIQTSKYQRGALR